MARTFVVMGVELWFAAEKETGDTRYPARNVPRLRLLWVEDGEIREGTGMVSHMQPLGLENDVLLQMLSDFPIGSEIEETAIRGRVRRESIFRPSAARNVSRGDVVGYYVAYRPGHRTQTPVLFPYVAVRHRAFEGVRTAHCRLDTQGLVPSKADDDPIRIIKGLGNLLRWSTEPGWNVEFSQREGYFLLERDDGDEVVDIPEEILKQLEFPNSIAPSLVARA